MNRIKAFISKNTWSPYLTGVLLGIVAILAVILANALLGASGAYESVAGWFGKLLKLSIFNNTYWGDGGRTLPVVSPTITCCVWLLVGTILGGTLGALSSGTFKFRWNDDVQWKSIFGPQVWKRAVIGFIGAMLLEYAAGIAGGCTSGLAISGGMTLTLSAFLFIGGMFVSGIITTMIVYGRRY